MTTLLVVLLLGATIRLTRLVTTDAILERPRQWIEGRVGGLAYGIRCDWCASWWVGLATFTFGWYGPDPLVWIVAGALTGSLLAGWVGRLDYLAELTVLDRSSE